MLGTSGLSWPTFAWPILSLVQGSLVLIPSFLLGWLWPNQRYRAIFRTWAVAGTTILIYAPVRLISPPAILAANALQILLTLLLLVVMIGYAYLRKKPLPTFRVTKASLLALAFVGFVVYPWLAWGALGSLLDTGLNLLAGLLFGLFIGLLLSKSLSQPLNTTGRHGANIVLGGLAGGTTMLMMASGFGYGGLQLILMLLLPALGWAVIMLFEWFDHGQNASKKWLPAAILTGIATAIPMMMVDPDELSLELAIGSRDQLTWTLYAALASVAIALSLSLLLNLVHSKISALNRRIFALSTGLVWLVAFLVYYLAGQPGFYGDQLFVILSEQATLSPANDITDYDDRRNFVYDVLRENATSSQAGLRHDLERLSLDFTPYYLINALAVDGGPLIRYWLESRPDVDRVLDNPVLRPLPQPPHISSGNALAPSGIPWNLSLIGADRVWNELGVVGDGIVVGHSDSGVQGDHPELAPAYRGLDGNDDFNWYDPWNQTERPIDIGGHGTHTLGSIVGKNTGVAPGAEWIGCVNLARNLANPALYLDCMQFMLAPFPIGGDPFEDGDPSRSAHVLNNSWGCPDQEGCDAGTLIDAVKALRAAGIFVVAAAGNDGPDCETIRHPLAIYDEVFSVGAVDRSGNLAHFSSRGPVTADGSGRIKPDIVAPGVDILSAFPKDTYEYLPGTSMAGPHVTGVIALIWSANPSLIGDIERTEEILRTTARPYAGSLPTCTNALGDANNGVGYGIVDAFAAVQMALDQP